MPDTLTRAQWRRLGISAYGPTLAASTGFGAVLPLIALVVHDMGGSVGVAAFMTALLGIGQLACDLPAGVLASRLGEKWAIVAACLVESACLVTMFLATDLVVLGVAVFITGGATAVVALARQSYLTEALPLRYRARGLSTLGGAFRIGYVIGPVAGAGIIALSGVSWAFAFAAVMSLIAAGITLLLPDLDADRPDATGASGPSLTGVLTAHAKTLGTVGVGALVIMMVRAARFAIIPLWCQANGLSEATTSLLFALSTGMDVLLFLPGGAIMDRFGRRAVAIPTIVMMGLCFAVLPLTHTIGTIALVSAGFGVANGVSSGIVMTLGSDASPALGRRKFLAGWRLFSDTGNAAGPLVITAVTAFAPLAASSVVLAALAWLGAGWLYRWVPRQVDH